MTGVSFDEMVGERVAHGYRHILPSLGGGWAGGATLGFAYFAVARGQSPRRVPWYDWLCILAANGCAVYIFVYIECRQRVRVSAASGPLVHPEG